MAAAAPASAPWQQAAASSARKTSDEGRSILIAVDFTEQSLGAAHWATCHLHRPGDVFHLVHVSRCVTPPTSIQHSAAGTSYDVPDPSPLNEQRHVAAVKGFIKERITRGMDAAAIPHNLHFFLELEDAPAREVVKTVVKVAKVNVQYQWCRYRARAPSRLRSMSTACTEWQRGRRHPSYMNSLAPSLIRRCRTSTLR